MANRYIDFGNSTGVLTGTWTFTINNPSVTAAGDGDAVNELANGDYIRQSDGIQWYKVTDRPDADTITLSANFEQATHTDDVGASLYNSEDGSAADGNAFCHHLQATVDEVRTAGDIIRTRGGLTYTYDAQTISFDEDGTINAPITLKGCYDGVDDPWGDGVVARPIIDFVDSSGGILSLTSRDHLKLQGFEVIRVRHSNGAIQCNNARNIAVEDCEIHNNNADSSGRGIRCWGLYHNVEIIDCELYDNKGTNISLLDYGTARISGCTLNGGAAGTITGLQMNEGAFVDIQNTTFGVTTEHSASDIDFGQWGIVHGRNVILDSTTPVNGITSAGNEISLLSIEDNGQVHEAYKAWSFTGTIEKDDGETPPGGSGWAMRGDETSNCGVEQPLYIVGGWLRGEPVYLDGTEQTITIKIKCLNADWTDGAGVGGRPSAAELFMELDYNDGASSWAIVQSTEACADDTYTSFTVTVTPNAAGMAYIKVKLLVYDTTGGGAPVYVDPVWVVS